MSTIENTLIQTINNSPISATITASIVSSLPSYINDHIANTHNPHNVTCEQISAMPYNENIVIDANYVHTDNNFISSYKSTLDTLPNTYATKASVETNASNIATLNSRTTTIDNNVTSLDSRLSTAEDDLTDINTALSNKADKVNGKGLEDVVRNTDYATENSVGVVRLSKNTGIGNPSGNQGSIGIIRATQSEIEAKTNSYHPIVPLTLDTAVKVGITTNTISLTNTEKTAVQSWLGIDTLLPTITIIPAEV